MNRFQTHKVFVAVAVTLPFLLCATHIRAQDGAESSPLNHWQSLGRLAVWDDGLCEMSYYDATDVIYGKERKYTRAHLLNRQWMDPERGVKTEASAENAIAVFKLNIAEEIPTENYNYRYLNTVFLKRYSLAPLKMVLSSQEWCGASYKHLRWTDEALTVQSFGYFPGEGESEWTLDSAAMPFEALVVLSRAVVAAGKDLEVTLLSPMRSTRAVQPHTRAVRLILNPDFHSIRTPAGRFVVQRVSLSPESEVAAEFEVETSPPYRLIAFKMGKIEAKLRGVERRAYWDRSSGSRFHKPGDAP